MLDPEDGGTTPLGNVGNILPVGTAGHQNTLILKTKLP
jgi:hypothetical protein